MPQEVLSSIYYEAHNGWLIDECEERSSAYRFKNMKNLPKLLGEEVHKVIDIQMKNMLEGKKILTKDEMIKCISIGLNEAYNDSHHRKEMWMERPKKYKMLHEIYYGQGIIEEEIESIKQKLTKIVQTFL